MDLSIGTLAEKVYRFVGILIIPFIVFTLTSCGNIPEDTTANSTLNTDTISDTTTNTIPDTTSDITIETVPEITVSGYAILGPVAGATVSIYLLHEDGTRGELFATTSTGDNGEFSYTGKISGPIAVVVTGGAYTDEATGEVVNLREGDELVTLLSEGTSVQNVGVTALTTIASARASENASIGLATAIDAANKEVAVVFGLEGVDIVKVRPADLTDDTVDNKDSHAATYGLVNAAFTQLAKDNGLKPQELLDLLKNISDDYSDGGFDGKDHGRALMNIFIDAEVTPDQALADIGTAADNFLDNDTGLDKRNRSGIKKDEKKIVPGNRPKEPKSDYKDHDSSTNADSETSSDTDTDTDTETDTDTDTSTDTTTSTDTDTATSDVS